MRDTSGSTSGTVANTGCGPDGIAIDGTAAIPTPASTNPSNVVTCRVSQMLGLSGVNADSARSSSSRLPDVLSSVM
ncbi:hypothetical protein XOO4741 [Xanthomonas oryzae pv. oryzae KACC 10331]|uniref:Uncharacterized protein n=1 Tax=Xanthomonas oryzae pv. oryzae (strain KACC10331 / KXO85) TaxID=291331 RepID=Q05I41_XANOR|nr:hypothetical protein XOO4741 [Xanthomonas oryzae pv. oryzae KACC 10331]